MTRHRKSARVGPPPGKAKSGILVPFLVFSGLFLALDLAAVFGLMPPVSPASPEQYVAQRQRWENDFVAERMIGKFIAVTPTRWSPENRCAEVGRGVWYAEGYVGIESPSGEVSQPWRILFLPPSQPLFIAVGPHTQGDFNAALRRAGLPPGKP